MKKNGLKFAGLGLVAALALGACDALNNVLDGAKGGGGGVETPAQFTADGRPLIELNVQAKETLVEVGVNTGKSGPSRALFLEQAKAFNFYEVLFKDETATPPVYYSAAVRKPNPLRIAIPAGTYAHGTASVLLLGDWNNGKPILLAIGVIDDPVISATGNVSFNVYALETDVTVATDNNLAYTADSTSYTEPLGTINVTSPLSTDTFQETTSFFTLPISGTGDIVTTVASFTIKTNAAVTATPGIVELDSGATTEPRFDFTAIPLRKGDDNKPGYAFATAEADATLLTTSTAGEIKIGFKMTVPQATAANPDDEAGFAALSFDVPVAGLDGTWDTTLGRLKNKQWIWRLKNGLEDTEVDGGPAVKSMGAGILFGIGIKPAIDLGIEVSAIQ